MKLAKCKIWDSFCDDVTSPGKDGWTLNSPRAGGKYELTGSLAACQKWAALNDNQKVLLTDYILEQNNLENIPVIHSGNFEEILNRNRKSLAQRKSDFLFTVYNRNSNFGEKVRCFGDGPPVLGVSQNNYEIPAVKMFHDSANDFLARTSCRKNEDRQALAETLMSEGLINSNRPNHSVFELTSKGYQICEKHNDRGSHLTFESNGASEYDVALSFAGEDRAYVKEVAEILKLQSISVFYDEFEEGDLWGKNLYDFLSDIYQSKAKYTVMFISEAYALKAWPNHERQAAQARAFTEAGEYILPARFDDTEIKGILATTGYIDLRNTSPAELVALIRSKLDN